MVLDSADEPFLPVNDSYTAIPIIAIININIIKKNIIALHYSGGFQQKYKKQKRHNVLNHNYIEFPSHKFFAV